jgi:hypothetical protein
LGFESLTDGLTLDQQKTVFALLQNQANELRKEIPEPPPEIVWWEEVFRGEISVFRKIWGWAKKKLWRPKPDHSFGRVIFPIIRRVFPSLIANDLVSVQPMTAPVGPSFIMNYAATFNSPEPGSTWFYKKDPNVIVIIGRADLEYVYGIPVDLNRSIISPTGMKQTLDKFHEYWTR